MEICRFLPAGMKPVRRQRPCCSGFGKGKEARWWCGLLRLRCWESATTGWKRGECEKRRRIPTFPS